MGQLSFGKQQNQKDTEKNSHDFNIQEIKSIEDIYSKQSTLEVFSNYVQQQGSYGDIYKGIHKVQGKISTIRIINKNLVSKEEVQGILQVVEILKNKDHPNVVKIQEIYQNAKQFYIITDHYEGRTLFEGMVQQSQYSEKDSAKIIKQVLQGLNYCHQHKIVHRDITPENIVFESEDKKGNIKIIDFGTSRVFDPHQKMNQKIGTPYYIAPEVLKKKYDEKCDIWSCGVLTYILLCGYPPFNGQSETEILEKVEKGNFDFPSEEWDIITDEAKDFISKLMEIDPIKRLTAEQALKHQWITQQNEDHLYQ